MIDLRRWLIGALAATLLACGGPSIERGSTLVVPISGAYVEAVSTPLIARLVREAPPPFVSLLSELKKAERDDRISNVVIRLRSLQIGWGQAQELRAAIGRLGDAGRKPVVYLEPVSVTANLEYYVATAAPRIHVAPAASAGLTGLGGEFLFLGGAFEKLGVEFEALRVGAYKGAVENIAGEGMSAPYREMANSLLDSTYEQFVAGIAEGRGLSADRVRAAIDAAPMSPEELLALGLIDGVGFFDELTDSLGGKVVKAEDYAQVELSDVGFDPVAQFALVYGSGNVVTGAATSTPTGGSVMASDAVVDALDKASEDPDIKAIVLRIDSPGGSPLAADIMWRALDRTEKPVVVSLANMAASGAYYVASAGDAIVAPPASQVGSIGVWMLRPVLGGLLDDVGVGADSLTRGAHSDMLLFSRDMSEGTRDRLQSQLEAIYQQFVARVATGRGMEASRVDELGGGRVYTGQQALDVGLVDALGGLSEAVLRAKEAAGIAADADVALVPYPPPGTLTQQLMEALRASVAAAAPRLSFPLPGITGRLQELLVSVPFDGPALVPPFAIDIR